MPPHPAPAQGVVDADPAGALFPGLAVAVPVEDHFDPAIFVGVDLFALGTRHDGGLAAVDRRPCRLLRGAVGDFGRETVEVRIVGEAFAGGALAEHLGLAAGVCHLGQQAALVEVVAVVLVQGEVVAGLEAHAVAIALAAFAGRLQGLQVDLGALPTQVRVVVAARVAVDLQVAIHPGAGVALQVEVGFFEVIVAVGDRAGAVFQAVHVGEDVVLIGRGAGGAVVDEPRVAGDGREDIVVVAHHQDVVLLAVFEEEADPLLFEQAADEVELRLPVLHAVVTDRVAFAQHEAVVFPREARLSEDLFDNLLDIHVLKNPAVAAVLQIPEPGHQGGGVAGEAPGPSAVLIEAADHGVNITGFVAAVEGQQGRLVDGLRERDIRVFRGELQLEFEGLGDLLCAGELDDMDFVKEAGYLQGKTGGVG